jgi:hypothetical protein
MQDFIGQFGIVDGARHGDRSDHRRKARHGVSPFAFGAGLARSEHATYVPAFITSGILCLLAAAIIPSAKQAGNGAAVATAE